MSNTLVSLVSTSLSAEDNEILSKIDLSKSNNEIISDLINVELFHLEESRDENQETKEA